MLEEFEMTAEQALKEQWGININTISDFWVDPEKLSVIQDLMFSGINVMLTGDPGTGKNRTYKTIGPGP